MHPGRRGSPRPRSRSAARCTCSVAIQVGADGGETTDTTVARLDLGTRQWQARAPLPIAIDDAVAVAWRDRWIVVVSGWSNTAPVAAVQLYDSTLDQWSAATPFPGAAVFGHAGALVGDELILVDGVTAGPRGFALTSQAWRGRLDPAAPTAITWDELPAHPAPARYRAAAGALAGQIVIHAGTDDPYNFDGHSYDTARPSCRRGPTAWCSAPTAWSPGCCRPSQWRRWTTGPWSPAAAPPSPSAAWWPARP